MVITHDNTLHCHLKQAHYSGNASVLHTLLTLPNQEKMISGGDGYYTHAVTLHGYHGTWAGLAARCLIIIINFSFTFSSENNNMLQLGTILNNEASALVLENFFQILEMEDRYCSILFGKSKNNLLVPSQC